MGIRQLAQTVQRPLGPQARFLEVAAAHLMLKTGPDVANSYEQASVMVMAVIQLSNSE